MRIWLAELIWAIAIALGLAAIFSILPFAFAAKAVVISLSLLALVWIHIARDSLSRGSTLRNFATYLFLCMIFLFIFSAWSLVNEMVSLNSQFENLFLGLAYIFLVIASYKLMKIGTEFGFTRQARKLKEIMKRREEEAEAGRKSKPKRKR